MAGALRVRNKLYVWLHVMSWIFLKFVAMISREQIRSGAMTTLTQYMKRHRLRQTHERFCVLEKVLEMDDHFTIDTLCGLLAESDLRVSRATVYHTIDLLVDAGLVRRHSFGNTQTRYENIAGSVHHHHLVCTVCGSVSEFSDGELDSLLASRSFSDFKPGYIDLYLYGTCGRCQRLSKNKNKKD